MAATARVELKADEAEAEEAEAEGAADSLSSSCMGATPLWACPAPLAALELLLSPLSTRSPLLMEAEEDDEDEDDASRPRPGAAATDSCPASLSSAPTIALSLTPRSYNSR